MYSGSRESLYAFVAKFSIFHFSEFKSNLFSFFFFFQKKNNVQVNAFLLLV